MHTKDKNMKEVRKYQDKVSPASVRLPLLDFTDRRRKHNGPKAITFLLVDDAYLTF